MLEIKHFKKNFGSHKVLKNISFSVKQGDVLSIIGPSGSGKSTLLRTLNFLEKPDSGVLTLDKTTYNVEKMTKKEILNIRRKTAMIFQNYALFSKKTVLENVAEALILVQKKDKKIAYDLSKDYLAKVGMENYQHFYPYQLSGGQQQRVGIARALAIEPKVILLDEPTSALDPELVKGILDLLQDIAHEKTTMILVTHEMNFAKKVSDQVIFLENGEIIEQGRPEKIFVTPTNPRTLQFIQGFEN